MNPIFKLSLAVLLLGPVVGCESTPDIHVTCTPDDKDSGKDGPDEEDEGGGGGEPDGEDAGATGGKDSGAAGGKDSGAAGDKDSGAAGNKDAAIDSGPAPTGEWKNATGNIAAMTAECGAVSYIAAKPDEDRLILGLAGKGLWSSVNGGGSWTQLGDGPGSAELKTRPSLITFDPADPKVYWMSGIYGPGAFRTNDNGKTFVGLGGVQHVDGVAVDFSDPERKVLVAGGHEEKQTVYRSADKGMTWKNIGAGLPTDKNCTTPLIMDTTTYLVGCSHFSQGIYRTTDSGEHWESVSDKGGSRIPLRASDGTIYWNGLDGSGLMRSSDDGKTWKSVIGGGVVAVQAPSPVELPDGRIAVVGTEALLASSDKGDSWKAISVRLPSSTVEIIGLTYSTQQKAFFIVYTNCNDKALTDAVQRYDYPMP